MEIKIEGVHVVICENPNNWKHTGMFNNTPFVKRDEKWYRCWLSFIEKDGHSWMQISNLRLVDEGNKITYIEEGVYKEFKISKFNRFRCEYALNNHRLNRLQNNFKKFLKRRRNTIGVFTVAIGIALLYFFGNEHVHGQWANSIAGNKYIQALFILLNIFSIGSIFYPFTIQKPLSENDIKQLCRDEMDEYEKEKAANERAKQSARF